MVRNSDPWFKMSAKIYKKLYEMFNIQRSEIRTLDLNKSVKIYNIRSDKILPTQKSEIRNIG